MSVLLEAMHATQRVFRASNESRCEDGSQKERYEFDSSANGRACPINKMFFIITIMSRQVLSYFVMLNPLEQTTRLGRDHCRARSVRAVRATA